MANAINSLNFGGNTYTFTLPYGTCSTAAGTAAKTVDVDNFSLETGARVLVKFTVTNTASSPTLNVEGTGAKAIYYNGAAITAGYLKANKTYEFVYNGTQWDMISDVDTNNTYSAAGSSLGLVKSGGDVSISSGVITVNDDSHNHVISNVDGLQTALDGKAASSHGTHVSYSTTAPVMDGTASAGSASTVARSDHKHPTDTSRASKTEFDTHVADTTKHITSTERTNWNAAKTHADSAHAPSNAEKNQNAFSNIKVGDTTVAADTATDTVTFVGSNVTITPDATNDKVTFSVADGSTSAKGLVQLTNSTSSTSTTTAATPNSVKSAYDLANTAKTNAATAQTRADDAYTLAESKADSLSDLGVTATATELNYVDGVTSGIQSQLDGKAASSHNHAASNITSGTLSSDRLPTVPVTKGGTGATTAAGALTNLGITATATELNYVDGVTSAIQTQLNNKAANSVATQSVNGLLSAENKIQLDYGGLPIVTTSGTGAAYTATVDGMTTLTAGMSFMMIPNVVSTSTAPTLNVNSLGAKTIRRRVSNSTTSTSAGYNASWLAANKPVMVTYDGMFWIADILKPSAADMSGTLGVANGGTGLTSVTAGNFLVGNGTSAMTEKTPAEVLTALGVTATATELNYVDGVTSNVQTQIDSLGTRLSTLEASVITVYSGTAAAMTNSVGSDGDVYLVTE